MAESFNEKSSFTADGIAYRRVFTEIPMAKEIWNVIVKIQGTPSKLKLEKMKNRQMLPFFEGRYILVDRELKRSKIKQILELAPGLSGRGIQMTSVPSILYVELDLPEKISEKRKVLEYLVTHKPAILPRGNLILEGGNAVATKDFRRAIDHFNFNQPIAVVCEGLLRYLSFADKKRLGRNIFRLLRKSGGLWITPDIEFSSEIPYLPSNQRHNYKVLENRTGINVVKNLFLNEAHALAFFQGLGFAVKKYPLSKIMEELKSPLKLHIPHLEVSAALRNRWVYVLSISA